eukprot:3513805-Amphidinium_carterae.1
MQVEESSADGRQSEAERFYLDGTDFCKHRLGKKVNRGRQLRGCFLGPDQCPAMLRLVGS